MQLSESDLHYLLIICLIVLSCLSVYFFIELRKARKRTEILEQATTHLALALETLNSESKTEDDDSGRTKSAIIGGIAGGGLGAIWGPVGVIAGSGIGSGIGNLAPDALEKAKEVVGRLHSGSKEGNTDSKKKRIRDRIPFLGKKRM